MGHKTIKTLNNKMTNKSMWLHKWFSGMTPWHWNQPYHIEMIHHKKYIEKINDKHQLSYPGYEKVTIHLWSYYPALDRIQEKHKVMFNVNKKLPKPQ